MKLAAWLAALPSSFAAAGALADSAVTVVLTPDGEQLATSIGKTAAELEAELQGELGEAFQTARVEDFIRAFGNATSFSNRGVGVDYASNTKNLIFGVAANLAVAAEDLDFDREAGEYPVAGIAPNLTAMVGLNLSRWKLPKWTLFANGFYRTADLGFLEGSISNAGAHAQYRIIGETGGKASTLFKWSGVDLTAGVEWTRWSFGLEKPFESEFPVTGSGGVSNVTAAADGRFDLSSSAFVLPLEATTAVRVLYVLSLFGGVGIDVQTGNTSAEASLTADLTATDPMGGPDTAIGTATATASGDGGPSPGRLRFLGGVQLNLANFKIAVQANAIPLDTASVTLALRATL